MDINFIDYHLSGFWDNHTPVSMEEEEEEENQEKEKNLTEKAWSLLSRQPTNYSGKHMPIHLTTYKIGMALILTSVDHRDGEGVGVGVASNEQSIHSGSNPLWRSLLNERYSTFHPILKLKLVNQMNSNDLITHIKTIMEAQKGILISSNDTNSLSLVLSACNRLQTIGVVASYRAQINSIKSLVTDKLRVVRNGMVQTIKHALHNPFCVAYSTQSSFR